MVSVACLTVLSSGLLALGLDVRKHPVDDTRTFSILVEWMKVHGASGLNNVGISSFVKGGTQIRGLSALRDIQKGEVFLSVPRSAIPYIDHPLVLRSPLRKIPQPRTIMTTYLASERRHMLQGLFSLWTPLIQTLPTPQDFEQYHPMYAKQSLLDAFEFVPTVQAIKNKLRAWESLWYDLQNVTQEARSTGTTTALTETLQDIAYEDFKWAHVVWQTRAHESRLAGRSVIVPLMHLGNADASPNALWYSGEQFATFVAARDIHAGEEITQEYHKGWDNSKYFGVYGFLFPDNPQKLANIDPLCPSQMPRVVTTQTEILKGLELLAKAFCPKKLGSKVDNGDSEQAKATSRIAFV